MQPTPPPPSVANSPRLVHTPTQGHGDQKVPSPLSSTGETPKSSCTYKWTTMEKIKETAQKLRAYIILLRTVNQGINVIEIESTLPELQEDDKEEDRRDIAKVQRSRDIIKETTELHVELLTNYRIYLRGILGEIAGINFQTELEAIEDALDDRSRKLAPEIGSSSPPKNNSPTQGKIESEPPEAIRCAWDRLAKLTELRVKLTSLFKRFAFVKVECQGTGQNDRFAVFCRKTESIDFKTEFNPIRPDLPKRLEGKISKWHPTEFAQISAAVSTCFVQMHLEVTNTNVSDFPFHTSKEHMTSDEKKLDKRLARITKEFQLNSGLFEKVEELRKLNIGVAVLREKVLVENSFEYICDQGMRIALHQRRVRELEQLKKEVEEIQIAELISNLKDRMQIVESASEDLNKRYALVEKLEAQFDEKVRKLKAI